MGELGPGEKGGASCQSEEVEMDGVSAVMEVVLCNNDHHATLVLLLGWSGLWEVEECDWRERGRYREESDRPLLIGVPWRKIPPKSLGLSLFCCNLTEMLF